MRILEVENEESHICENFTDEVNKNLNIGYSHSAAPFIIIPTLTVFLNIVIVATHIRKKLKNKREKINSPPLNSIESLLFIMTWIEMMICIYWLVNGTLFNKVQTIMEKCQSCFVSSLFSIFIQNFDWAFFTCTLHNLVIFVTNPHKEHDFKSRLKWYFIFSFAMAGAITYIVIATGIYGISVKYFN